MIRLVLVCLTLVSAASAQDITQSFAQGYPRIIGQAFQILLTDKCPNKDFVTNHICPDCTTHIQALSWVNNNIPPSANGHYIVISNETTSGAEGISYNPDIHDGVWSCLSNLVHVWNCTSFPDRWVKCTQISGLTGYSTQHDMKDGILFTDSIHNPAQVPASCTGRGGVLIGNQCLVFVRDFYGLDWKAAVNECKSRGGSLANPKDLQAVLDYANTTEHGARLNWWVGAKEVSKGDWRALDDSALEAEQIPWWGKAKHTYRLGHDCLILYSELGYRESNCLDPHPYICDIGLDNKPEIPK